MRLRFAWVSILVALCPVQARATIELRGGVVVEAPIESVSLEGVRVAGDEPRIIGWDSIKRVFGDAASEAASYAAISDKAWRARLRLSRGDHALAEPLFEELFEIYRGHGGPTALMVFEGLLRCRLREGRQGEAAACWLEAVRLREMGVVIAGDPPMLPLLDQDTFLVGALPPIWLPGDESALFARSTPDARATSSIAVRLGELYRVAACFENGLPYVLPPPDAAVSTAAGSALVEQVVLARVGGPDERAAARRELEAGIVADLGTWREVWRRVAIGRSLLREDSESARFAGVIQLLHVPARFGRDHGYLSGIALAEAAAELHRRGDHTGAGILKDRLAVDEPNHPALRWLEKQMQEPVDGQRSTMAPQAKEATVEPVETTPADAPQGS